jgi:hypothetical protein
MKLVTVKNGRTQTLTKAQSNKLRSQINHKSITQIAFNQSVIINAIADLTAMIILESENPLVLEAANGLHDEMIGFFVKVKDTEPQMKPKPKTELEINPQTGNTPQPVPTGDGRTIN